MRLTTTIRGKLRGAELLIPSLAASLSAIITLDILRSLVFGILVLALQTIGSALIHRSPLIAPTVRSLSAALLVSIVLVVEIQQFVLRFTNRGIPIVVVVTLGVVLIAKRPRNPEGLNSSREFLGDVSLLGISSFITLLLASRTYFWIVSWAVFSLCLAMFGHLNTHLRTKRSVLTLFATVWGIAGLVLRDSAPILISEEQVYYDLLSKSLAVSVSSEPLFTTTSTIKYHWLSYAFIGWMDRELQFEQYSLMSGIAPILFGILVVLIVLRALNVERMSFKKQTLLSVIVGTFISRTYLGGGFGTLNNFTSPSQVLSLLFGAHLMLEIGERKDIEWRSRNVVLALLAYGAVGSYVTSTAPIVAGSVIYMSMNLLRQWRSTDWRRELFALAAVVGTSGFALWRFTKFPFAEASDNSRLSVTPLLAFAEQLSGEVRALYGTERTLAKVGYFLGLAILPLLAVVSSNRRDSQGFKHVLRLAIMVGVLGVVVTQTGSYANNLVLLTGMLIFAIPLASVSLVETIKLNFFVVLAATSGALTWLLWISENSQRANYGGIGDIRFRLFAQSLPAVLAIFLVALAFGLTPLGISNHAREQVTPSLLTRLPKVALVGVLTFGCLQGVSTWWEGYGYYNSRFERWSKELRPSPTVQQASKWITKSLPSTALIAVDQANNDIHLQNLMRLSERHFLVAGPNLWAYDFRLDQNGPRLIQMQRLLSSPSDALFTDLRNEGVTHIILRREISRERVSVVLGAPVFSNDDWWIFVLPAETA